MCQIVPRDRLVLGAISDPGEPFFLPYCTVAYGFSSNTDFQHDTEYHAIMYTTLHNNVIVLTAAYV